MSDPLQPQPKSEIERSASGLTFAAVHGRRQRGFTIIELMVVIALMGILLAMALPSFDGIMQRYRVSAAADELANALQFARADAIRSRYTVYVTATGTPDGDCAAAAIANGEDWHCGVDVWEDVNGDGNQQPAGMPPEPTLKTVPTSAFNAVHVQVSAATIGTGISYAPMGDGTSGDRLIYIWPTANGAAPSANTLNLSTVCATQGGKVKIVPAYVDSSNDTACSS